MEALNDLEILAEMVQEIVWAPNLAIGTMMKKEAERYAKRFEVFSTPADQERLKQALEFAYLASGRVAEKEHWKANMTVSWSIYERALRQKMRAEQNPPDITI